MTKAITIVPKNIVFPTARVLDKEDKELYAEVETKTKEKFGKNSRTYKTIFNGINTENVTGSNYLFNSELGLHIPKNQSVISLDDMEEIYGLEGGEDFFKGFYTDVPEIILITKTPSWKNNKHLLENLVSQVPKKYKFDSENPLRISGLESVKCEDSENHYGLLLKVGDDTKIVSDDRFAYSNNGKQIDFGGKKITVRTKEHGLSRVFLYGHDLYSWVGDLANSGDYGRVVVRDAEGVAPKKLNEYLKNLAQERDKQITEITEKYKDALKIMKS